MSLYQSQFNDHLVWVPGAKYPVLTKGNGNNSHKCLTWVNVKCWSSPLLILELERPILYIYRGNFSLCLPANWRRKDLWAYTRANANCTPICFSFFCCTFQKQRCRRRCNCCPITQFGVSCSETLVWLWGLSITLQHLLVMALTTRGGKLSLVCSIADFLSLLFSWVSLSGKAWSIFIFIMPCA